MADESFASRARRAASFMGSLAAEVMNDGLVVEANPMLVARGGDAAAATTHSGSADVPVAAAAAGSSGRGGSSRFFALSVPLERATASTATRSARAIPGARSRRALSVYSIHNNRDDDTPMAEVAAAATGDHHHRHRATVAAVVRADDGREAPLLAPRPPPPPRPPLARAAGLRERGASAGSKLSRRAVQAEAQLMQLRAAAARAATAPAEGALPTVTTTTPAGDRAAGAESDDDDESDAASMTVPSMAESVTSFLRRGIESTRAFVTGESSGKSHTPSATRRGRARSYVMVSSDTHALVFYSTVRCLPSEIDNIVAVARLKLQRVSPRLRLRAFADLANADDRRDVFSGVIQVVPMATMLQVHVASPIIRAVAIARLTARFDFLVLASVAVVLTAFVNHTLDHFYPNGLPFAASVTMSAAVSVPTAMQLLWLSQLSAPMCRLLLRSYDFWLLVFWISVGLYARIEDSAMGRPDVLIGVINYIVSELCVLTLDARALVRQRTKAVIFALNAAFHAYQYALWWVAVTQGAAIASRTIDVNSLQMPLPTVAQTAALALVVFNVRLAARCGLRKLDLALVEFPVNVMPHSFVVGGHASSVREVAALTSSRTDAAFGIRGPRSSIAPSGVFRELLETGNDGDDDEMAAAAVAVNDGATPADVQTEPNFGDIDGAVESAATSALYGVDDGGADDSDAAAAPRRPSPPPSLLSKRTAHLITLHIDGSVPFLERPDDDPASEIATNTTTATGAGDAEAESERRGDFERQRRAVEEALKPAVVDSIVVENTGVYATDRRTYVPIQFIRHHSPRPIIASRRMFVFMCRWQWPWFMASMTLLYAFAMSFEFDTHATSGRSRDPAMLALQMALIFLWFSVVTTHLLCAVSLSLAREAVHHLDFSFTMSVFFSQMVATCFYFGSTASWPVVIGHGLLVSLTGLFFALLDAIAVPSWTPRAKGCAALALAGYTSFDIFYNLPNKARNPSLREIYGTTIDLRFTVIAPATLTQLAGLALLLLYLRIAARTLLMGSGLVYMQVGARLEEDGVGDDGDECYDADLGFASMGRDRPRSIVRFSAFGAGSAP